MTFFLDFMKVMIGDIFTTQHMAQTINQAAAKGLLEKAASGNCPQKCKVKLKVSLANEEYEAKCENNTAAATETMGRRAEDEVEEVPEDVPGRVGAAVNKGRSTFGGALCT